ncbi:hypothetical protein R1flu_013782 [Riccia fluitans]|uniref:Uncharacterized protein n=1 Tax=Riccia fluitans TaxID=41844 RepID=A0ABD1YE90_9MARC
MAGSHDGITLCTSPSKVLFVRKSPRQKMKASKGRMNYPRLLAPLNLSMQQPRPRDQTPKITAPPTVATAPIAPTPVTTAEPKEQCYDDPEICIFCDDGGSSIIR